MSEAMIEQRRGRCVGCGAETEDTIELPDNPAFHDRMRAVPLRCPTCSDAAEADVAAQEAEHELAMRQWRFEDRVRRSGLPKSLYGSDFTLDALDTDGRADALDAARRFGDGDLKGALFVGPFGAGKTTMAGAAAKRHMLEVGPLRWLRVHEVTINLSLPFDHPARAETISSLRTTGALILDDLDKTRPTAYAAEPLFSAIDRAVSDEQPLLITANLDLAELAERWPVPFGEGIASRLAGYCEIWHIGGRDRRLPQAA